jgi:hypothetical protein
LTLDYQEFTLPDNFLSIAVWQTKFGQTSYDDGLLTVFLDKSIL